MSVTITLRIKLMTKGDLARKIEVVKSLRPLVTVREAYEVLKEAFGKPFFGRDLLYALARRHGTKVGRRWLIPRSLIQRILEGELKGLFDLPEGLREGRR